MMFSTKEELITAVEKEKDESTLLEIVRHGGELLKSDEHAKERIAACFGCENVGEVTPLPLTKYIGCKLCRCPFASKAYMASFLGNKADCPHPSGSRWAKIDKNYKNG